MDSLLYIEKDERLYKIIIQTNILPTKEEHKIISKINSEGKVAGVNVIKGEEEKQVITFEVEIEKADDLFKDLTDLVTQLMATKGFVMEYKVIDLTIYETLEEQMEYVSKHPELFTQWDTTTDSPRRIRVDNPFLLDDDE